MNFGIGREREKRLNGGGCERREQSDEEGREKIIQ